ncbi:MAG: bifunctional nuclease family protein [Acidimicrobiales bacterium]
MVEMTLASIRVQLPDNVPVVLLKEVGDGARTLPILIGHEEATSIARAIQGQNPPRPLTHDLMKNLLDGLDITVEAVVITELVDAIFFAEIRLRRAGELITISSRPSDAIALAVRTGTTIYADDALIDAEGMVVESGADGEDPDQVIEDFQRFVAEVRPEDFAS